MITDTQRLEWLVKNRALVHTIGENTDEPQYCIVYRNGETSDTYKSFRIAIDKEIIDESYKS